MCPRMCGNTTSRSCCQVDAPASRAVSRCDGGTLPSAAPKSSIENAVPRQVLKMMIDSIGCSSSQRRARGAEDRVERAAVAVEERDPQEGDDRAGQDPGQQDESPRRPARSGPRQSRSIQAMREAEHGLADDRRAEHEPQRQPQRVAEARVAERLAVVVQPDELRVRRGLDAGEPVVGEAEVDGPDRRERPGTAAISSQAGRDEAAPARGAAQARRRRTAVAAPASPGACARPTSSGRRRCLRHRRSLRRFSGSPPRPRRAPCPTTTAAVASCSATDTCG